MDSQQLPDCWLLPDGVLLSLDIGYRTLDAHFVEPHIVSVSPPPLCRCPASAR